MEVKNMTNLEYDKQIILLYEKAQFLLEQYQHFCLLSSKTVDKIVENNENIDELILLLNEFKEGKVVLNFIKNKYNVRSNILVCSKELKENFYSIENKIKLIKKELNDTIIAIEELLKNNLSIAYYTSSRDIERAYNNLFFKYANYCLKQSKKLVTSYNKHQELEVDKIPSLLKKVIYRRNITKERENEYELILLFSIYSKILSNDIDIDDYDLVLDINEIYGKDVNKVSKSALLFDLSSSLKHYLKPLMTSEKNNRVRNRK